MPPLWRGALRAAATGFAAAAAGVVLIGPEFLFTDRAGRQERLARLAPRFPLRDPKTLSPLAARLRGHVVMLAETIGERDIQKPAQQARAGEYIMSQLTASGYAPKKRPYRSAWLPSVKDDTEFRNIEAVLPAAPVGAGGAWIVGAHYDSASGTPGADDNASGVAVLLEAARLLKARRPAREVRFVAFGTEEPPAFGTPNMGSDHYSRELKESGARVHGMIGLEMLGYYNPKRGAQFYAPFFHLLYPARGDYLSLTSNYASRGLLASVRKAWRAASAFPLETAVLPGPLASMALSDQLNFWDRGFAALMLSDTAFYRNPNYHEASDTPETLDYEKMAEATEALVSVLE
ncbi:MAG: M28 family peptidase [Elusimicrobia bacterium]|nr:M28 family peptidase [Elusimicrobiota bacterium]